MKSSTLRRTIRLSALYDLVVTAGFALPFTAPSVFVVLAGLHRSLGLPRFAPDGTDPYVVLFANLMGSLVVVWAIFRLLRPTRAAGAADTAARALFSLGMAGALLQGASALVAVMLVLELVWAAAQGVVVLFVRASATGIGSSDADR